MAIRSLARALTSAAALLVLLGATASGSAVTVADGALTPRVVVIPAGGRTVDQPRHAAAPDPDRRPTHCVSRLPISAGRRAARCLRAAGAVPVLLDGVVTGIVFVTARTGPTGPSGPIATSEPSTRAASARAGCGHPTIYRYDVRVAVHRQTTDSGSASTLGDWKASWVAPLSVERCGAVMVRIVGAALSNDELHGGQSDITSAGTRGTTSRSPERLGR